MRLGSAATAGCLGALALCGVARAQAPVLGAEATLRTETSRYVDVHIPRPISLRPGVEIDGTAGRLLYVLMTHTEPDGRYWAVHATREPDGRVSVRAHLPLPSGLWRLYVLSETPVETRISNRELSGHTDLTPSATDMPVFTASDTAHPSTRLRDTIYFGAGVPTPGRGFLWADLRTDFDTGQAGRSEMCVFDDRTAAQAPGAYDVGCPGAAESTTLPEAPPVFFSYAGGIAYGTPVAPYFGLGGNFTRALSPPQGAVDMMFIEEPPPAAGAPAPLPAARPRVRIERIRRRSRSRAVVRLRCLAHERCSGRVAVGHGRATPFSIAADAVEAFTVPLRRRRCGSRLQVRVTDETGALLIAKRRLVLRCRPSR